jgi:hypothetical protein
MMGKQLRNPHSKVGIFWCIDSTIIGDAVSQEKGEPYGDAIQYGGHFEFWENLAPASVAERKFKSHAYDYYPRGRMVLFPTRRTVRLYVDRCMDGDAIKTALEFFGPSEYQFEIEKDEHYQCAGCNRHYLE